MSKSTRLAIAGALVVAAFAALFAVLPPSGPGIKVEMKRAGGTYRFRPATVRVPLGGAVTFFNDSDVTHTATCPACGFDTSDVLPGKLEVITLTKAGTFRFSCRYYGADGMVGTVIVGRSS